MVVSITWSETASGSAMSDPKDWGNIGNGSAASSLGLFVRHNGNEPITNCGLYIQPYSGTGYSGAGATADYNELLGWGDTSTSTGDTGGLDGGFWINQTAMAGTTAAPAAGWKVHKAATGIAGTEFGLPTNMNLSIANQVRGSSGTSEEATFYVKLIVPSYVSTAGTRFFDQVLKYTYTS